MMRKRSGEITDPWAVPFSARPAVNTASLKRAATNFAVW